MNNSMYIFKFRLRMLHFLKSAALATIVLIWFVSFNYFKNRELVIDIWLVAFSLIVSLSPVISIYTHKKSRILWEDNFFKGYDFRQKKKIRFSQNDIISYGVEKGSLRMDPAVHFSILDHVYIESSQGVVLVLLGDDEKLKLFELIRKNTGKVNETRDYQK